jgi:hypothetical protein
MLEIAGGIILAVIALVVLYAMLCAIVATFTETSHAADPSWFMNDRWGVPRRIATALGWALLGGAILAVARHFLR